MKIGQDFLDGIKHIGMIDRQTDVLMYDSIRYGPQICVQLEYDGARCAL